MKNYELIGLLGNIPADYDIVLETVTQNGGTVIISGEIGVCTKKVKSTEGWVDTGEVSIHGFSDKPIRFCE